MARRLIGNLAIPLALATLLCLAPQGVQGGNIHQSFGMDFNDPVDQFDDQLVTYRERWDSSATPVPYYLYHDYFTGAILYEIFYPDYLSGDEFDPLFLKGQISNALKAWNGCSFSNFEFDEDVRWSETAFPRLGQYSSFYTVKDTAFDGINLITFQDEVVNFGAGEIGLTSRFVLIEDFDLEEQRQFPVEIISDSFEADETYAWVDWDEDGIFDVLLPLREYKQGEYLDADVVINGGISTYRAWPDDPSDIDGDFIQVYNDNAIDIRGVVTHELGHAHGIGHAQLWESTMSPFLSIDIDPPNPYILICNPYNQRTPNLDDFISQSLQYPKEVPSELGAIAGQVIDGDFIDGFGSIPATIQVPVYLCVPAETVATDPDYTDRQYFDSGATSSFIGYQASFADQQGAQPMVFKRIASSTTSLDMRVYPNGGYEDLGDTSNGNPDAPPATLNGDFYFPGIPIRDDYALFTTNEGPSPTNVYSNVNDVMSGLATTNYFPGEFYGGANMPGIGSGYVTSNESTFDTAFGNNYIEAAVDGQGRLGVAVPVSDFGFASMGLTAGYGDRVDRGFAVFKIDGKTYSTYEEAPGPVVQQMVIDDRADRATGRWRIEHGEGVLDAPRGITFKSDGKAFVSNGVSNAVMRFNGTSGIFEQIFATDNISSPRGLLFDKKGRFYVASEGSNQILRYNGTTGEFLDVFVDTDGGLQQPRGMVFDMKGDLLVCSYGNDRILRFQGPDEAQPGELIDVFVGPDKFEAGGLDGPNDLALDNDGNLQVTSELNNKVMRYYGPSSTPEQQGRPRGFQGLPNDATLFQGSGLSAPHGLLIAPSGDGIVASYGSSAIIIYDSRTGAFQKNLIATGQGGLSLPTDISFGPNDNYIYICSEGLGRVLQYDRRSGAFIKTFATSSGDVLMTLDMRLSNAGGVELETNPRAANDVNVTYRFQNTSSTPATIELRQTYDLAVLAKDGPIYFADAQQVTQTREWTGAAIPKYLVFQNALNNPMLKGVVTLTGSGTGGTAPSRLVIEQVQPLLSSNFNVSVSGANIADETGRLKNTGIAAYYGPVTINPGETVDFGLMIGTLLDELHVMKDSPFGRQPLALGTVWEDNLEICERIAALPGQVVDGITIITDTGFSIPGNTPSAPPGTGGQLFSPENDRLPQRILASQDGVSTDIDNDGDLDIVLLVGRATGGQPSYNRLLENRFFPDGDLRFVDTTFGPDGMPGVGVDNLPINSENSMGVAAADFNNDGFVDLFFSNSAELGVSGVNRIYLNRGDGSFLDVTTLMPLPEHWLLPGIFDSDPISGADPSMKPTVGDIDSDGDMDIVIPQFSFFGDFMEAFQDVVYSIPDSGEPPVENLDGLYFQKPQQGGEAWQVDEGTFGSAEPPARVLVNQLQETGVLYFIDDTLGRDYAFAGFQPIGGELNYDNLDRIPPVLPEFAQTKTAPFETELILSTVALLGTFVGDSSLDLLIGESTFGSPEPVNNTKLQPNLRVYNNFDVDGDYRPDGYFAQINYGMDFTLYPRSGIAQTDLCPFFIGIPNEFPDSTGPWPESNRGDLFGNIRASINAVAIADLSNQGVPSPITALTTGASYYFPRKFFDVTDDNKEMGAKKGFNGYLTGWSTDFDMQNPFFDMTLEGLADRYNEFGIASVEMPGGAPGFPPLFPGDPWDVEEGTPNDGATAPGNRPIRYDIPDTIGRWPEATVNTADGNRTRDVVAADFDRDGDVDLFYANDFNGGDGTLGDQTPVPNSYFSNNGDHTFTEDQVATTLALEELAESAGAIPGDFDNDGDLDLYICNPGNQDHMLRNTTFRGTPNLTSSLDAPMFYDATPEFLPPNWSVSEPPLFSSSTMNMTYSSVASDLNCDGRPDLYVGNGGDVTAPLGGYNMPLYNSGEIQAPGIHVMRPPTTAYPAPALIQTSFPTEGSGRLFGESAPTTGVASVDVDRDGDYDLIEVNYETGPLIYLNEDSDSPAVNNMPDFDALGDGVFSLAADLLPILDNPSIGVIGTPAVQKMQNMCVAMADLDCDGDLDMVIGNGGAGIGAPNVLLINRLNETGMFEDASEPQNAGEENDSRLPFVKFPFGAGTGYQGVSDDTRGVALGDFNDDGCVDIFFANSAIMDTMADSTYARYEPNGDIIKASNAPQSRKDGVVGCRLLLNDPTRPGYFFDASMNLPDSLRTLEVSNQPLAGTVKLGDFDGIGERSEDVNYNGILDPGYDLDGDGLQETGEDSFFSYLSANRGSIINDNGSLDFDDSNDNGSADLSLDIFIGYETGPDILLMNNGAGGFTDGSNQLPNSGSSIDTRGADVGDVDLDGDLDIVMGLNTRGIDDPSGGIVLPTALIINDGSGAFSDASYEMPIPDSVLAITALGLLNFGVMNDVRDVDFIDFENDGDLDLFVSVAGDTESIQLKGYLNYVLINRMIGSNWNAERTTVAQVPGKPVIRVISPPWANPGTTIQVLVTGANFEQGSTFSFGSGVSVVGSPTFFDTTKAQLTVSIAQDATVGPRSVTVTLPSGKEGISALGAFNVITNSPPDTAVRGNAWMLYETATPDNTIRRALPGANAKYE